MKFLRKLWGVILAFDLWILDKFQRFSDWITKVTGVGNAHQKIIFLLVTAVILLMVISHIMEKKLQEGSLIIISFFIFMGALLLYTLTIEIWGEKRHQTSIQSARISPYKYLSCRLIFLFAAIFMTIFGIIGMLPKYDPPIVEQMRLICLWLLWIIFFFVNCSGLPPKKGKIRNWIKGLFKLRKSAPVKIPSK